MRRRRLIELLLVRWGFAVLVAVAIAIAIVAALTVAPPLDVPAVALKASVVYRVEVGAAVFLGLYIATMAFALALQNRGLTEIGSGGVRARELAEVSQATAEQDEVEMTLDLLSELLDLQSEREGSRDVGRETAGSP